MIFSVDAHTIGCHLTGNEVYVRNLLNEFAALDRHSQFLAFVSKPDAPRYLPPSIATRKVSENPFARLGWEIPLGVRRDQPSLLHVQYTGPSVCSVPLVVTVHDVSFLDHPEYFTPARSVQLRLTVKRTVRQAARILTPSEFSKRAVVSAYGVPEEKVVVVRNGVSSAFRPLARELAASWLRDRHGIDWPYVLTVGDLQPRKNHLGLIRAFEDLLGAQPQLPHRLVIAGKEAWHAVDVRRAAAKSPVAGRIHFTGWVPDEDLPYFYAGCDLFVFPSFYEGFGLPIIEAMACGRAVACSNRAAMPEVANAAGILFDPKSTDTISRAMHDVLMHPELRARMERLGVQRAALFDWNRAAQRTLDVYYDVAGGKASRQARPAGKRAVPARP